MMRLLPNYFDLLLLCQSCTCTLNGSFVLLTYRACARFSTPISSWTVCFCGTKVLYIAVIMFCSCSTCPLFILRLWNSHKSKKYPLISMKSYVVVGGGTRNTTMRTKNCNRLHAVTSFYYANPGRLHKMTSLLGGAFGVFKNEIKENLGVGSGTLPRITISSEWRLWYHYKRRRPTFFSRCYRQLITRKDPSCLHHCYWHHVDMSRSATVWACRFLAPLSNISKTPNDVYRSHHFSYSTV